MTSHNENYGHPKEDDHAQHTPKNTYFIKFGNILLQGLHPH